MPDPTQPLPDELHHLTTDEQDEAAAESAEIRARYNAALADGVDQRIDQLHGPGAAAALDAAIADGTIPTDNRTEAQVAIDELLADFSATERASLEAHVHRLVAERLAALLPAGATAVGVDLSVAIADLHDRHRYLDDRVGVAEQLVNDAAAEVAAKTTVVLELRQLRDQVVLLLAALDPAHAPGFHPRLEQRYDLGGTLPTAGGMVMAPSGPLEGPAIIRQR